MSNLISIEDADETLRKAIRAWSAKLHIPVTRMMSRALREEFKATLPPPASAGAVDERRDIDSARELLARVWEDGLGTHELRRDIAAWLSNDGIKQVDAILAAAPEPVAVDEQWLRIIAGDIGDGFELTSDQVLSIHYAMLAARG